MKSLVTLSCLLMTAATAFAQPLAQEQFIIGPAGVGYTADTNIIADAQKNPIATSPLKGWYGSFNNTDADGIADRYLKDGNKFIPIYPVANSLNSGALAAKGGKLMAATGGIGYLAQINTALDGPLSAYSTNGTVLDKDGTTLYISFLYKLNNLNVGANQNVIDFIDGVNTTRQFDNTAQTYVRNYTGRYTFGQAWGSDTISDLIQFDTATHLVVMKIEYKAGNDTLNVYIDPDSSKPEAQNTPKLANNSRNMSFNGLRVCAQQATANTTGFMFDELRFGSSWESVTPQAARYTLTLGTFSHGTVTKAPDAADYLDGADVILTATPEVGYKFMSWSGDVADADKAKSQITVSMTANKTITPEFVIIPDYNVTVTINPVEGGSVELDPTPPVKEGTEVTLLAVAEPGYKFVNWTIGGQNFSTNPLNRTLTADLVVTANFAVQAITLNPTSVTIPAAGGQFSIGVSTGIAWSAVKAGAFITLNTTSGTGNGTLTYTIAENKTTAARTGTITVRETGNNTNNKVFNITQSAPPPPVVNILESFDVDLGDFGWRSDIGFTYMGFYPYVYIFEGENWIYVFPVDGLSETTGYFLYDFGRAQFGWSGTAFYPNYAKLPADGTNVNWSAKVVK
ncbi:MAG: BACON domain-containing carbohydrate-binding protein [Verrucomicrobiota bacterium]|nr:BACON domain-containing carbohydrate-binding protein [Verrucomicrobiota bacterium]